MLAPANCPTAVGHESSPLPPLWAAAPISTDRSNREVRFSGTCPLRSCRWRPLSHPWGVLGESPSLGPSGPSIKKKKIGLSWNSKLLLQLVFRMKATDGAPMLLQERFHCLHSDCQLCDPLPLAANLTLETVHRPVEYLPCGMLPPIRLHLHPHSVGLDKQLK